MTRSPGRLLHELRSVMTTRGKEVKPQRVLTPVSRGAEVATTQHHELRQVTDVASRLDRTEPFRCIVSITIPA
jgi:hypothetical protein